MISEPQVLKLNKHGDERGALNSLELPFAVKRVYCINNPTGLTRGHHAHKSLNQVFFSVKGNFVLSLSTPLKSFRYEISELESPIVVPPGYWRVLSEFSVDCTIIVLASQSYDESDYIRNYDEYLEWFKEEGLGES